MRARLRSVCAFPRLRPHARSCWRRAAAIARAPADAWYCLPRCSSWPTESLDQTTDDAHASLQAQLLERNHVEERLEQVGEARGTHATQSDNRRAQRAVDWHGKAQKGGIDIQPEYSPQSLQ